MVTVCRFFSFWCYFDLVKRVKFGVSRHFGHALWIFLIMVTLYWNLSYLGFWGTIWRTCGSKCWGEGGGIFPTLCVECCLVLILMLFWLSETDKIWGFQAFWSCSVDFPHYGDPLAEIGHIWGFWALSGERVGVNVEGRTEAYFRRFASSAV